MSRSPKSLRYVIISNGRRVSVGRATIMKEALRSIAGEADPQMPPSAEALQRVLLAGMCGWCERGPFKSPALHIQAMHSITGAQLAEMAWLPKIGIYGFPEWLNCPRCGVGVSADDWAAGHLEKCEEDKDHDWLIVALTKTARGREILKAITTPNPDPAVVGRLLVDAVMCPPPGRCCHRSVHLLSGAGVCDVAVAQCTHSEVGGAGIVKT